MTFEKVHAKSKRGFVASQRLVDFKTMRLGQFGENVMLHPELDRSLRVRREVEPARAELDALGLARAIDTGGKRQGNVYAHEHAAWLEVLGQLANELEQSFVAGLPGPGVSRPARDAFEDVEKENLTFLGIVLERGERGLLVLRS
jgi:hypothetical protein